MTFKIPDFLCSQKERNEIFSIQLVSPTPNHTQINYQVKVALTSALLVLVGWADFR